jgi:hypothetical protein
MIRARSLVLIAAGALIAVAVVACWPVTTRFAVDYQQASAKIPLYEKALNFISRDLQARRLAREITAGASDPRAKALTVFRWVGARVRKPPSDFPVLDDHLWNVIVRGYGAPDQRTEVYALLATYAGLKAASTALVTYVNDRPRGLMVAVTEFEGRRWLFDVDNQFLFTRGDGTLAALDDLMADPTLITRVAGELTVHDVPYLTYFAHLGELTFSFDRIRRQQPLSRLAEVLRHPL